jgi:hypothetical protein
MNFGFDPTQHQYVMAHGDLQPNDATGDELFRAWAQALGHTQGVALLDLQTLYMNASYQRTALAIELVLDHLVPNVFDPADEATLRADIADIDPGTRVEDLWSRVTVIGERTWPLYLQWWKAFLVDIDAYRTHWEGVGAQTTQSSYPSQLTGRDAAPWAYGTLPTAAAAQEPTVAAGTGNSDGNSNGGAGTNDGLIYQNGSPADGDYRWHCPQDGWAQVYDSQNNAIGWLPQDGNFTLNSSGTVQLKAGRPVQVNVTWGAPVQPSNTSRPQGGPRIGR